MLRALRHRDYRLFFGGQLLSMTGTWIQSVAQSWLVYRLTGSSLLLGLIGFTSQIPVFLAAPIGGAVADRRRRHRILLCTQVASMLLASALAAVTLTGHVRVAHLFVLSAVLGVVNGFDIPARQAFVVEMVGPQDLMNAIALNSSMVNGARLVGPALAGLLVGSVGEGWCFAINAVSFLAVIAGLLAMRQKSRAAVRRRASAAADVLEGFAFVWHHRPIRALVTLLGVLSLAGMPYVVLMPIFADRILHGGPRALGMLMGASGAGALVGALALAARKEVRGLGTWIAVMAIGFGVALAAFAFSRWFWISTALLVPVGGTIMVSFAATNTLIQTLSPDAMRGRVMAVYTMTFMGMAPLGALLAGSVADRIGPPATLASGGLLCGLAGSVFAWKLPSIRKAAQQIRAASETVPPPDPPA
jgi:MFS family permease